MCSRPPNKCVDASHGAVAWKRRYFALVGGEFYFKSLIDIMGNTMTVEGC